MKCQKYWLKLQGFDKYCQCKNYVNVGSAGVAVNTGYSPSQIVSATYPEVIPAEGTLVTLIVVAVEVAEHPCASVTRTVTSSPSLKVVEEMCLMYLMLPCLLHRGRIHKIPHLML